MGLYWRYQWVDLRFWDWMGIAEELLQEELGESNDFSWNWHIGLMPPAVLPSDNPWNSEISIGDNT
jgi:hypothetical protein